MTGYGKAVTTINGVQYSMELRSLNSKGLEMNIKLPPSLRPLEVLWRGKISNALERGKIDFSISIDSSDSEWSSSFNLDLLKMQLAGLKTIATELQISDAGLFQAALMIPGVLQSQTEEFKEEDVHQLEAAFQVALDGLSQFRLQEGKALEDDLILRMNEIQENLNVIKILDPERISKIRTQLHESVLNFIKQESLDTNRFEQELIYYIERLDITEEIIRLESHLTYFVEVLKDGVSKGRKLNFISQEMGREINTIGSKASDKDIQKLVVQMKDGLEKIKEQLNNIL